MAKLSPDNHLSGSALAAYMGHSPWQDAYDVVLRARESLEGKARPELDSLQVDMGDATEDVTLERGCRLVGLDPAEIATHSHKEAKKHPRMDLYYSDDGLHYIPEDEPIVYKTDEAAGIYVMTRSGELEASGRVVLEAKFTTTAQREDDPPLYRGPIQVQAGMMCHAAEVGIIFTNYGGRKLTAHIYMRHRDTQTAIQRAVQDFEQHMTDGTWPEPRTAEEAAKLHPAPKQTEEEIELDANLAEAVRNYQAALGAIKSAEEIKAETQAQLMAALGENSRGRIIAGNSLYQVSWPVRNYKAKPAELCTVCNNTIKPATEAKSVRQKTISIKEQNDG